MDIHKPKAAHDWREFAVEIGTIICGILIALGLEQVVEWTHGRHEVAQAREAIRTELAFNATRLGSMTSEEACADARLALLEDWSRGQAHIDSGNLAAISNRPLLGSLRSSAWEVAKTGAVAAHMPVDERLAYATLYDLIANQMGIIQSERQAWIELARFAGRDELDPAEAKALRGDIAIVRANASARRFNTPKIEAYVARLGIKPTGDSLPPGRTPRTLCEPPK